jgi:hypothetical protein
MAFDYEFEDPKYYTNKPTNSLALIRELDLCVYIKEAEVAGKH